MVRGQRAVRKYSVLTCLVCGPKLGTDVLELLASNGLVSCNTCGQPTRDIVARRVGDEMRWFCVNCIESSDTERMIGKSHMQTQFESRSNGAVSNGDTSESPIPGQEGTRL